MRYMTGLNEWLARDVNDRQNELQAVLARVDQLARDVAAGGGRGGQFFFYRTWFCGAHIPLQRVQAPLRLIQMKQMTIGLSYRNFQVNNGQVNNNSKAHR